MGDDGISRAARAGLVLALVALPWPAPFGRAALAQTAPCFGPATSFGVGSGPVSVAVGDFDRDGDPDLAVANSFSNSVSVLLNTCPPNDPPVITAPAADATDEDTARTFSAANGNRISVGDPDAGANPIRVSLAVTAGTLTLNGTAGLTFSAGDGTADPTLTFTGAPTDVNAALDGLRFDPPADFADPATLTITADDQGHSGTGGPLLDTATVALTVRAVNDPPTNAVPGPRSTPEDTPLVFSTGNANRIAVADADAGTLQVTLAATNGTLTLNGTAGLTFSVGDGTADPTLTFSGPIGAINDALNGLRFDPTPGFGGAASLQITADDQGRTGAGGALTDTDTVPITVGAVNDPPTISDLANRTIDEDTSTGPIPFTVGDAETDPAALTVTAGADNPALLPPGSVVLGGAGADRTVQLTPAPTSPARPPSP